MLNATKGETDGGALLLPELLREARAALAAADRLVEEAQRAVAAQIAPGGRVDPAALDRAQFAAHGFAWYSTYAAALRQLLAWAEKLEGSGRFGERERLMLQIGFGEYLAQLAG
ncbi:MAG: acyl-CoA dehydrogenase, partial [Dongiaceae bacterium]